MGKRTMDDIIVRNKRKEDFKKNPIEFPSPFVDIVDKKGKRKRGLFFKVTVGIFLAVMTLFLFNIVVSFFASATVKIVPKQEFINIDLNLKGQRGITTAELPFEVVQMSYKLGENLEATEKKDSGGKASGKIVIYNTFSTQPQALVNNTRFETPDGKIYRINKAVTIPGSPGSIEVTVYADEPGEEYNIGLSDFTIPGFKGSSKYEKIYARSKTEIKGGFLGATTVVSQDDIDKTRGALREKITNYLNENILKQKTEDFIFFSNSLVVNFGDLENNPQVGEAGENFYFEEEGEAIGFLIKKEYLSKVIAKRYLGDEKTENVRIENIENLTFEMTSRNGDNSEIVFNLKGEAHFVWNVDSEALILDLINAKSSDFGSIFKKYSEIEKADIVFSPSWWQIMSKNRSHVRFEEVLKSE